MVNHSSTKTARESKREKFITHRYWRRYRALLEGLHGDIKALYRQRVSCRTWDIYLYRGLQVECFWDCSQIKTEFGNLNQKELGFGKFLS